MIGLDTNVVVRYLVRDDPIQAARADDLIERRLTNEEPGYINLVALVETVWVLKRAYGYPRGEISRAIRKLLQSDELVVAQEREVFAALTAFEDGPGDFSDVLIGQLNAAAGCARTLSFDHGARRLPGFEPL